MLAAAIVVAAAWGGTAIHDYRSIHVSTTGHYPIKGVDVSAYQGSIDWDTLAGQDIAFAFIKATEGSDHTDAKFAVNWKNAAKADLRIGAYHFLSYDSSGSAQARHFIDTVKKKRYMLPPVIDVEFYGQYETVHPSASTMMKVLTPLSDALEKEYGVKPILYTTPYIYENYLAGRVGNDIWISDPELTQPLSDGTRWTFCQYSFYGTKKGYEGGSESHIDLDVFDGDRGDFFRYCR